MTDLVAQWPHLFSSWIASLLTTGAKVCSCLSFSQIDTLKFEETEIANRLNKAINELSITIASDSIANTELANLLIKEGVGSLSKELIDYRSDSLNRNSFTELTKDYKELKTEFNKMTHLIFTHTFRTKNSFGALEINEIQFQVDPEFKSIEEYTYINH